MRYFIKWWLIQIQGGDRYGTEYPIYRILYLNLHKYLCRTIYWSDVYSNVILKASLDGRDVKTVISLNSSTIDYAFTFTLDYSQQLLYWIYYESCYYRIESSSVNGDSERRTIIHGTFSLGCHYGDKPAIAIDFFKGAVYYSSDMEDVYRSRYTDHTIFKITVEHTQKRTSFSYIRQYVCHFLNMYSGIKIISPERQLQGIAISICKTLTVLHACIMQV